MHIQTVKKTRIKRHCEISLVDTIKENLEIFKRKKGTRESVRGNVIRP